MPKKSRKRKIVEDKSCDKNKSTTGWFDIPQEMREMVIEEMDAKTKCKFTQCAKKCEDEVKASKNFVTGIEIDSFGRPKIRIAIGELYATYRLEFIDILGSSEPKTMVVYKTDSGDDDYEYDDNEPEKWTKIEDGRVEDVRMKYFNEYNRKYLRSIETIVIEDDEFGRCIREKGLIDLAQIVKLPICYLQSTDFAFEEFLQFEGDVYRIHCYDFTEKNVEKYLKMLKKGDVHRNLESLNVWSDWDTNTINFRKFVKSLDAFDFEEEDSCVEFRFLLNYQRKSKCYCKVEFDEMDFIVQIVSHDYEKVMKNRRPLDF